MARIVRLGRGASIPATAKPVGHHFGRDLLDCRSLRCSLAWSRNLGLLRRSKPAERGYVCAADVYWFSHPNLCSGMVRPVRHFRQEEHHWTLNPNKQQGQIRNRLWAGART